MDKFWTCTPISNKNPNILKTRMNLSFSFLIPALKTYLIKSNTRYYIKIFK